MSHIGRPRLHEEPTDPGDIDPLHDLVFSTLKTSEQADYDDLPIDLDPELEASLVGDFEYDVDDLT